MNETEIEHRLTAVEQKASSNSKRIDKMEHLTDEIHAMSKTMVKLVEQGNQTNQSVNELKNKVDELEKEPAQNYKKLKNTVVTAIVSGVLGAIISGIIALLIK